MLRNNEFNVFMLFCFLLSAALCLGGFFISPLTAAILAFGFIILNTAYFVYTKYRYKEIRRLCSYLQQIYSGSRVLDIRENTEGELSILKNDIYKITTALQEKSDLLAEEKAALALALADISHQLKTPLTGAIITADLLQTENLPQEKTAEFANKISHLLEKLSYLISTLLKLSQLDADALSLAKTPLNIDDLISAAAEPLLISAEIKGAEIYYEKTTDISWTGDEYWTAQALSNIIKNCIETVEQGGKIKIKAESNPIFCKILIEDNGGGINSEDLPHIFKRFYKGHSSKNDSSGIGLALSKSIIEKQGGSIEAENTKEGALFTVYLPKLAV